MIPVYITGPAEQELKEIWHHYAEISEELADRMIHRIRAQIALLRRHPEFGRPREEFQFPGLRSTATHPHVIFYSVSERPEIIIHHVADGRRDLAALFENEN